MFNTQHKEQLVDSKITIETLSTKLTFFNGKTNFKKAKNFCLSLNHSDSLKAEIQKLSKTAD